MFGFSDEHKMVRQMIRRWVEAKLLPANEKLEKNEVLPYDLMRDFIATFGIADMVRSSFEKATSGGETSSSMGGGDAGMQAMLCIELSRINPGFFMSMGASMGLAGGAIMAKGTPEQKKRWGLPLLTFE